MKQKLLTLISIMLLPIVASRAATEIGGIYYNLSETGAEVTNGTYYSGAVIIPSSVTYNGNVYSVTSIGNDAFRFCSSLTSVTIPNSVTSIGNYAFWGCSSLTSVTIPNSVTSIGNDAFRDCSGLTSITIPNSVTSIGNDAFSNCSGLTSVTIGSGVTSIGNYAFWGCSSLTSVTIPNSVTSIGYYAFLNCSGLTSVTIPNSVTSISSGTFSGCSDLTSVTIPESVTSIGDYAFQSCSRLTSITIPNSVTSIGNYAFSNCSGLTSITIPNSVTSIGGEAFYGCSGLTSVTIPESVTSIGYYAFSGCSGLTSITIPNSVTSIGNFAFSGCSSLTSITIPGSVTGIGANPFAGCSALTSVVVQSENKVFDSRNNCNAIIETAKNTLIAGCKNTTIPNSVTSIANYAFTGCSGLTSVTIPSSVTSIGYSAFSDCSSLTSITIPNSVTSIGDYAFKNCSGLTNITIPEGVTSIGISAFSGCSGLTSVTIPNSVTSIGSYAFYGCSGLISITIPNSVTSIGSYAFSGCSLTSITIPNSVTSISDHAFDGYSGLTSITIPSSVTSIGNYAFRGCSSLTSVTIPNSVTSIGNYAFSDCSSLTSVTIPNSVTSISSGTFQNCSGLTSVTIPNSVTSIGSGAFYGCSGLTSITIPESVTSIGGEAFYGCSGLTSVTIPESVTSIVSGTFAFCSGLTSVTIPNSVTGIGDRAFRGCSNLTSIVVNSGNKKYDSRNNCNAIIVTATNTLIVGCKSTTIPNSVTSIGYAAFSDCNGLTAVTIPNNVTSIGSNAFSDCSGLTAVTIPNNVTSIGSNAFSGCSSLNSIVVESGNTKYDSRNNCNAIIETATNTLIVGCRNTIIPNSVTRIDNSAFNGCSGLTSVTIPNSVTSIGYDAFAYCSGLASVTIGNSVTDIEFNPFVGCSSLTSITVQPENNVYDSRNNCNAIIETATNTLVTGCKNTTIPSSVTNITHYAFRDCSSLTSITIPNGVTIGGESVFRGCSSLTDFWCYAENVPKVLPDIFYDSPISSATLHVPAASIEQYKATEPWSGFGTIVAIEGQGQEYDCDWTIGKGGDFADIKAAMEDSRVQDGHVLQLLPGTSIGGNSYINNKAVTIKGNGYKDTSDGYIGSVYIDCDNVTLRQLYLGNVYIRANNATIEHCRAGNISGTENYDANDATIHGCFVTGTVHSYYNNVCYGWNISNNIIFASNVWGNILDYLEEATVDHNLIINYNNENITGVYAVGAVKHSSFTNNIFIRQMFSQGISPDATDSAEKFEYNIVSNTGTYSKWPTNKTGYRNMEELFVCTGEWTTDTYYKLAAGSPAIGYANDGGNCGPWSGKYPYWTGGIEPDATHWKLDPTLTTDLEQHEFATLDALIGYMTDNLNKLKESVTVNVADATYTMDVLSYLMRDINVSNEDMILILRERAEMLIAQMQYMSHLISQGITFNMEAPHEAIFQFNIQNSESLADIEKLLALQTKEWLAQGMSQEEVDQRIAWLSKYIADTQTQALSAMKRLTDIITLTNISVYIDGKLYPADPTKWKLDPKLTTDPEQYKFASLEALMNYLTDTKNIQKLPEGTTVNVAVADTTFAMDAIQDYSNVNDVDELLANMRDQRATMQDCIDWLIDYSNWKNITLNMVAQQGAVFQFYIQYSQAFKHAQELMAAKEKELLAQGVSQSEVNERKHNWQNSLESMRGHYPDIFEMLFTFINRENITIQFDPKPQWKLDPKLTTNAEQHEFATLDGFVNYLLDNCFNLKESIKVNVADATYTMDVIPNLGNSNDVEVLIKELEGTCNDFCDRVAEIMKWFDGNNITINMEAPHAAVLQFNIQNSQAVKQIQNAIAAKMQEMLAQGKSQDEVNAESAKWYEHLKYIISYSTEYFHELTKLFIKTTNITIVVDPTQQWKLDPKLNNNPEQHEFATLEALVSYLLTHPLTESITVNVADATYSMEMMPNDIDFSNYSMEQVFLLVREKFSVIKAMLDYYAAYPLISIYMKAPNEAIFEIYMLKCLALYYQIPAYLNYKAYEMLAEGKSRTEVAQQMAAWKTEFDVIKKEALNYMQMLANRLRTTNISILIDPDPIPVPDPIIIIDPDDMLCLRNLYDRLGGSSWTNKKWKFNGYMAQKEDFPGVTFDDEGYVVEINLENNNLRGSLNPSGWTWELGLPRLSGLYLQKNNISGNLSPWLHDTDRAGRLKTLNMSYNNLTKISDSIPSSITSLNLKNQNREWYRPSGVTIDPLKIEVMKDMPTVRLYLSSKQSVSLPSLFTYDHKSQTHSAKPDIHIVNAQGLDKYGSFYSTTGGSYALSWGNEEYTEKQDAPCYIRFGGPYDGSVYPAYLRYIEGDANISGYTDVVDVQTTLNYVLAGGGVSQFNRSAANTYVDNQINVQDIVCTVNIILDDVAAPEDIVTTPSSTRRRLRRAAEAFDAQCWLYTNQGCVMISSAEEVGSIDVELKGVSTRQVSLMLNHSQYQMIGRDTEHGSRYIIFSPTGQPIPASEEVTLLAISSQAEVVAAQAADMEAQEMTLAIGQPTGIAQVLGGAMNATFQGDELVVTTTTDIQNLSLRLYSTGGQMVLVNEEDNMPKGELRMKAPVSPGAYILEMTTRQGGRKIVKLMKR